MKENETEILLRTGIEGLGKKFQAAGDFLLIQLSLRVKVRLEGGRL